MTLSYYNDNEIQEYCVIIYAYESGLISYVEYMNKTREYIAYHELTEKQLLQAYARANAFFLEPSQIEHWFNVVLTNQTAGDDYEQWLSLYHMFQKGSPHDSSVGALEKH